MLQPMISPYPFPNQFKLGVRPAGWLFQLGGIKDHAVKYVYSARNKQKEINYWYKF